MSARIPRFTHAGVTDAEISVHPFATEDGLGLQLTRFRRADCDDVVLLVHGLTMASDMFIMPEHRNLVTHLHDEGFTDVWAVDFRMSNRYPYDLETHRFTLDHCALYDHPAALAELRRHIGDRRVHVIAHCLGAVTFMMSLYAGTVEGIASVVCNSVALTPRVPRWSRYKLAYGPTLAEYVLGFPFLDPRFGEAPPLTRGWLLSRLVSLAHRECDVRACHMLSFMWGSGRPALYEHRNLDDATHRRIADICGGVGVHYYRHVHAMVEAGRAVKYDRRDRRFAALPDDYLAAAGEVSTPALLLTGDRNRVFGDSNLVCHARLQLAAPGRDELQVLPGYGHMDPFLGKEAHVDVFPTMVDFIKRKAA
ncbi:alpha/beta fold hydrolase [Thermomonospora catenispora]|uniref:alpha/beta fold hydrolase n=1 Tax=Thermomonospora catenispora TaxID=2493090 RepID=UPI001124836A|nr:alpha/beta hydrolase [Thermomonospora catenispora]TNY37066.1 alpha/beta fold hydrolase [Thermomonospora catenispora]